MMTPVSSHSLSCFLPTTHCVHRASKITVLAVSILSSLVLTATLPWRLAVPLNLSLLFLTVSVLSRGSSSISLSIADPCPPRPIYDPPLFRFLRSIPTYFHRNRLIVPRPAERDLRAPVGTGEQTPMRYAAPPAFERMPDRTGPRAPVGTGEKTRWISPAPYTPDRQPNRAGLRAPVGERR